MGYLFLFLKSLFHQSETMIVKKYGQKHRAGGMFLSGNTAENF